MKLKLKHLVALWMLLILAGIISSFRADGTFIYFYVGALIIVLIFYVTTNRGEEKKSQDIIEEVKP